MQPRLTPTQRLMMIALRAADRPLSIDALASAIDSTACTVLDRAAPLVNTGILIRQRIANRTHYSLPVSTPDAR